jgi:hypothetical protein
MVAGGKEQQGMNMPLDRAINYEQAWKSFLRVHCSSMFQTALLLSADARVAAAALADSIGDLDLSNPPEQPSLAIWERAVITRSIGAREPDSLDEGSMARSMLQSGLSPVIEIEHYPRICFVLRVLLGYAAASCAQTLGIAESEIQTLVQKALTSLCGITAVA